ncbi:MAG: metal-dependent transcriptional regulator [Oscillospiraceae bacterium]|nr:metal-dependent transcriptional regulator [Oscillospiraceae bacterium]
MNMHESGEMYLETILILGKRKNNVRAIDIADEMKLSKASVSRALGRLKSEECIIVDNIGHIAFTEKGRRIAEKIYERHEVLTEIIMALGVDRETAAADACKIEHDISDKTFAAMRRHRDTFLSQLKDNE